MDNSREKANNSEDNSKDIFITGYLVPKCSKTGLNILLYTSRACSYTNVKYCLSMPKSFRTFSYMPVLLEIMWFAAKEKEDEFIL